MRLLIERHSNLTIRSVDVKNNWKHGFLNPGDGSLPTLFDGTAILVLTRDVFHWLPRMYKDPFGYLNDARDRSFSEFIRTPYREQCFHFHEKSPEFNRSCHNREWFETADNLIHARTLKYKNWIYVDPRWFGLEGTYAYSRRSLVRYESLLKEGQEAVLGKFLGEHCVVRAGGEFRPVVKHASYLGEEHFRENAFVPETHEEVLKKYTDDDLHFVLGQLDREFERNVLEYSYDYVEEYLRIRRSEK